MIRKLVVLTVLLAGSVAIVATYVTPWPSVWLIRGVFDHGAEQASAKLEAKVPTTVEVETGLSYDPADRDAVFDIYRGKGATASGPVIVWFHGGGFVSGRRGDVANYLKILAGRGFTVVNVDYTIAPEATYPEPIRQANKALAYLTANGRSLGINVDRVVLAGDSAGAQIAAQTAAMLTNPPYAKALGLAAGARGTQLAGALLYCGVYDVTEMGSGGGILGWFVKSTAWAYSGQRDWRGVEQFKTMSVAPHVTPAFPPTFISAGNADPLAKQSLALSNALKQQGVAVETMFFAPDYQPPLGHEYQFDLDTAAGRQVLDDSVRWLLSL